ncbi:N-acetyltransferase ESCO2-like [Teratosphaeria destructans]|uniref:N-acetyltransferase ESCO2-like n=1 Tax=Teratosphaeria destructans TaxID=418781 RepID=A0A9W7W2H6_9PEZI|nr:N-acetyltransferase ESCO2-like [Teratosphaeria destructans]
MSGVEVWTPETQAALIDNLSEAVRSKTFGASASATSLLIGSPLRFTREQRDIIGEYCATHHIGNYSHPTPEQIVELCSLPGLDLLVPEGPEELNRIVMRKVLGSQVNGIQCDGDAKSQISGKVVGRMVEEALEVWREMLEGGGGQEGGVVHAERGGVVVEESAAHQVASPRTESVDERRGERGDEARAVTRDMPLSLDAATLHLPSSTGATTLHHAISPAARHEAVSPAARQQSVSPAGRHQSVSSRAATLHQAVSPHDANLAPHQAVLARAATVTPQQTLSPRAATVHQAIPPRAATRHQAVSPPAASLAPHQVVLARAASLAPRETASPHASTPAPQQTVSPRAATMHQTVSPGAATLAPHQAASSPATTPSPASSPLPHHAYLAALPDGTGKGQLLPDAISPTPRTSSTPERQTQTAPPPQQLRQSIETSSVSRVGGGAIAPSMTLGAERIQRAMAEMKRVMEEMRGEGLRE